VAGVETFVALTRVARDDQNGSGHAVNSSRPRLI
jgi:hypothetical protein